MGGSQGRLQPLIWCNYLNKSAVNGRNQWWSVQRRCIVLDLATQLLNNPATGCSITEQPVAYIYIYIYSINECLALTAAVFAREQMYRFRIDFSPFCYVKMRLIDCVTGGPDLDWSLHAWSY